LNAGDSTISLNFGNYYAIAFLGFGQHIGAGTVSFLLDGVTPYSQNVTFPDPALASPVFANFALPGGDSVTISATGLSADRIQIVADGGGLFPDGTPDAFFAFIYASGTQSQIPEPGTGGLMAGVLAAAWAVRRRFLQN
jgi:hypothetical protein